LDVFFVSYIAIEDEFSHLHGEELGKQVFPRHANRVALAWQVDEDHFSL